MTTPGSGRRSSTTRHRSAFWVLLATAGVAVLISACTGSGGGPSDLDGAAAASFTVRGGVAAITVVDAEPGAELYAAGDDGEPTPAFFPPAGTPADRYPVDEEGNLVIGRLDPGSYRVAGEVDGELVASEPVEVTGVEDIPDQSFYDGQVLEEGYQYLEMRDGTTLAAMVRFPAVPLPGTPEGGPYPTVIEYSGYDPSNPSEPEPATLFADTYGYATVGVNMRGTTCSGGSFSHFEPSQVADGYDVIETIAAQDWVQGHKVGMVGLSYPGLSQTYVAQAQPPSLAAIAPLSILGDLYRGVVYPGGIYNAGFIKEWSENVGRRAEGAVDQYVADLIAEGDTECEANLSVRSQNLDLVESAQAHPTDDPTVYDPINPAHFAGEIEVPTYITGQWQDEQLGGYASLLAEELEGNDRAWLTFTNGAHGDGLAPALAQGWLEFLDLYVAERIPELPPQIRAAVPVAIEPIFGGPLAFGPDRFADAGSYEEALAEFEERDRVTVLFESGAGNPDAPGTAEPTFEMGFDGFPVAEAEATTFWLDAGGGLGEREPTGSADDAVSYEQDPGQSDDLTIFEESDQGEHFSALPPYEWVEPPAANTASWVSEPFPEDRSLVGPSRVDLWLSSTTVDTDIEVTLSEVRPDGTEFLIQSGWQRASLRALDPEAGTDIRPVPTFAEGDVEPLVPGRPTEVSVEIFPVAHVLREGSRLRVSIDSPGGNRVRWKFDTIEADAAVNTIGTSTQFPSRITVPFLDLDAPEAAPPCPSLRGQPCRQFQEPQNTPATLAPSPA